MRSYKIVKLKMKVTYEAWRRDIEIGTLIHYAILKSMQKRQKDAAMALRKLVLDPAYNAQHRLFSIDESSSIPLRNSPDENRFISHIKLMTECISERRKEKFLQRKSKNLK